jgi:hypothetical protein
VTGNGSGKRSHRVPNLVERARAGSLAAWSELLPPGWLRGHGAAAAAGGTAPAETAPSETAPSETAPGDSPSVGPAAGRRSRRVQTIRFWPVPIRVGAVIVVVGALALVAVTSIIPSLRVHDPVKPILQPGRSDPGAGTSPEASVLPSASSSAAPEHRGRARSGGSQAAGPYRVVGPASPRWGYAWMDKSTGPIGVETALDPQWQWTTGRLAAGTAGRRATAAHNSTGSYTVRLPAVGFSVGIAHATSYSTVRRRSSPAGDGHSCAVAGYRAAGVDELVDVRCHDLNGAAVDVQFDVFFTAPNTGSAPYASVRYDPPGGAGTVSPVRNSGTWNTAGGDNHVYQQATGRWRVELSGAALAADNGYAHVTAYGTGAPARCQPESTRPAPAGTGLELTVACYAINAGAVQPVNSGWALSYARGAGLHHDASVPAAYATTTGDPANPAIDGRHSWASTGESPALARLGVGTYRVTYNTIGTPDDAPQVTAVGAVPRYCRLTWWDSFTAPPQVSIDIYCYDNAGNAADALFAVAYLRGL